MDIFCLPKTWRPLWLVGVFQVSRRAQLCHSLSRKCLIRCLHCSARVAEMSHCNLDGSSKKYLSFLRLSSNSRYWQDGSELML